MTSSQGHTDAVPAFKTAPIDVLTSCADVQVGLYPEDAGPSALLPFVGSRVEAGFPSPAEDFIERYLSLDELLIQDKASTFIVRVQGPSMIRDNIHPGDILIVDRAKRPRHKSVVIAVLNGDLTVKRLMKDDEGYYLKPANHAFPVIRLREGCDFQVWGVVTFSIHKQEE